MDPLKISPSDRNGSRPSVEIFDDRDLSWLCRPVRAALDRLLRAHLYAADLGVDPWEFALPIRELRIEPNDVRWLVHGRLVDYAMEVFVAGESERHFRPGDRLEFNDELCLVLTARGVQAARELSDDWHTYDASDLVVARESRVVAPCEDSDSEQDGLQIHTPCWDRDRKELRVGRQVVKRFKATAANQEVILATFQEENWPVRIDDPLPPRADIDPKRRLHDTINSLNRSRRVRLISFLGDGSGQGVRWEFDHKPSTLSL